jgi:adenylate kinase family enzyme
MMRRVVVLGIAGVGKTTAAGEIALRLGLPHVEVDRLIWSEGWRKLPEPRWGEVVSPAIEAEAWVLDGDLPAGALLTQVVTRADAVVWLDYPAPLAAWRVLRRSVRRLARRERLWGTANVETARGLLLSRRSPFVHLWATTRGRRAAYGAIEHPGLVRLRRPTELGAWIDRLPAGG